MLAGNVIIIIVMIILTAFFVAAEFGLVKIRKSQLSTLAQGGNQQAKLALDVVGHLDEYLSACQLGITLTSLAIGWVGESTVSQLLQPLLIHIPMPESVLHIVSLVLSFFLITFVHVVIGELIPKSLSISKTEAVVLTVVTPLHWFYKISYPFIWLLNSSAAGIGKLFGLSLGGEGEETHSEEELLLIANESLRHGEINQDEYEFLNNVFDFDELMAKEIMVTRLDMETIDAGTNAEQALAFALETGHSRFPVIGRDKDDILGYVTLPSLIKAYLHNQETLVDDLLKEAIIVMETLPVKVLLAEMQKQHKHFAILADEYGGTSGLVTIEDILEEIVGDIQDEQDKEEEEILQVNADVFITKGRTSLSEFADFFHVTFETDSEQISIGGYLIELYQGAIKKGFICEHQGLTLQVVEMDRVTISKLKITDNRE